MIITLQDNNHNCSGKFSVNTSPVHEKNIYMLDVQTNHCIVIPKTSLKIDDTSKKKEKEIVKTQISKDILQLFSDLQTEYVQETHKQLISTLTIKKYLYPIIK